MIITGGSLSESEEALKMARGSGDLFCTAGVHPTRAGEVGEDIDGYMGKVKGVLKRGVEEGKVVAVGECGLDYDRLGFCGKEQQMRVFRAMLGVAEVVKLPLFLHNRNTGMDFVEVMKEWEGRIVGGVVHSFTGSVEEMKTLVSMGLYIGINGCSMKKEEQWDVVRWLPLSSLMIETDCPYCGIKGGHEAKRFVSSSWETKDKKKWLEGSMVKGRNEPCCIRHVCEAIAGIRGCSEDVVAKAAFDNSMKLFWKKESDNMGSSPYEWSAGAVAR